MRKKERQKAAMAEAKKAAVAVAVQMVEDAIRVFMAAGLDGRANNILRIGLAGIRKGIRTEKEKEA